MMQSNDNQTIITNYMYAGLLPFFAGALGPWIFAESEALLTELFLFYSSLILVFLAGIFWAIALFIPVPTTSMPNPPRHIHAAIVFSLWPLGAYLLPTIYATAVMMIGFLLLLFWEKRFINPHYADWYQKLRHKITFIVVACHMLVIFNLLKN